MDILIMDTDLNPVYNLDVYTSFIWTDRFAQYGDFELYTPATEAVLENIKTNYYLSNTNSDHLMIIETIEISTNIEEGSMLKVTGRSLESILDRRIVWGLTTLNGDFQTEMERLLNENVINPTDVNRKIDNFVFEASTDEFLTSLSIECQYTGDNLYDVIAGLCADAGIGFQITLNNNDQFVFKFLVGVERDAVIFSPSFDNLINSNYVETNSSLKTATLIGGEGEGVDRTYETIDGDETGLNRRELFTDARDIQSECYDEYGNVVTLSESEYSNLLLQRGSEKLSECIELMSFEGSVDTTVMYTYGIDYFLGDILYAENEYGYGMRVYVAEMVMKDDAEGYSTYPTLVYASEEE